MRWYSYAVAAALLYGLHQIFTKLASKYIGDGLGAFVVELAAAIIILFYLGYLRFSGSWNQQMTAPGVMYSVLAGICVGIGTIVFFLMFQKGGPLSAVPMILAGGAAMMAVVGMFILDESRNFSKILSVVLSIVALVLLKFSGK
ncbi:MAG: hypothetical protein LHV69_07010 [Elusimicrobia bacterium]|nr:hypothetical protein [Candidatus Obscuribacterium magneticum]